MANQFLFANFVAAELVAACKTGDTIIQVNPTGAAALPPVGTNQQIALTLWDGNLPPEIVYCTNNPRTGPLTVVRGQESTVAQAWPAGSQVKCIITAAVINQALNAFYNISSIISAQFLPLAGGTLTGPLILSRDPINQLEAVTKEYVDHLTINALPLSGGTMTGPINMNNQTIVGLPAPTIASAAANKAYVDGAQSGILGGNNTFTGNNTFKGGTNFTGSVAISGPMGVNGNSQFNGTVTCFGNFGVNAPSSLFAGGDLTVATSTFHIASSTSFSGTTAFAGPIISSANNTWSGENDFTGPLTANNSVVISGPGFGCSAPATFDVLNVTTLNATNLGFSSGNITGTLTVNGLITGGAGLNITGNFTLGGNANISGDITATSATINGPAGIAGNLSVVGSESVGVNLNVGGQTTTAALDVTANSVLTGSASFGADVSIGTTLLVNGASTLNNLTVNGPFLVNSAQPRFASGDGLAIPLGPTGSRPATPFNGTIRFNTNTLALEYYNGSVWISTGNIQVNVLVFNSTAAYTPTVGMQYAEITCVGGGGAGGGSQSNAAAELSYGDGGGAGGVAQSIYNAATIGVGTTVTVGTGGAGVAGASGQNGTASTYGSLTGAGGNGGASHKVSGASQIGAVTAGGGASGGTILNLAGDRGAQGMAIQNAFVQGGRGGSGYLGMGGGPASTVAVGVVPGTVGQNFGSGGGGGAGTTSQAASLGGNGAPGIVIIKEYILVT